MRERQQQKILLIVKLNTSVPCYRTSDRISKRWFVTFDYPMALDWPWSLVASLESSSTIASQSEWYLETNPRLVFSLAWVWTFYNHLKKHLLLVTLTTLIDCKNMQNIIDELKVALFSKVNVNYFRLHTWWPENSDSTLLIIFSDVKYFVVSYYRVFINSCKQYYFF